MHLLWAPGRHTRLNKQHDTRCVRNEIFIAKNMKEAIASETLRPCQDKTLC